MGYEIKKSEISLITKLLNSKYEDDEEIFQNVLKKIKPFKNIKGNIPIEMLEKLIYKYEIKYNVMIVYICPVFIKDSVPMYSVKIKDVKTKEYFPTIYGSSMYETLCKICLLYYMEIGVKNHIGLKDWSKKYEG